MAAITAPLSPFLGELDGLPLPGHMHADPMTGAAHACGHNSQIGIMLGAAIGLMVPEVLRALCGDVDLMALPAEEFVDVEYRLDLRQKARKLRFLSGKQGVHQARRVRPRGHGLDGPHVCDR